MGRTRTFLFLIVTTATAALSSTTNGTSLRNRALIEPTEVVYLIDATQSRLTVTTEGDGLATMFAHDHRFSARELKGVMSFVPEAPVTASIDFSVRANSLRVLDEDLASTDRQHIEAMVQRVLGTTRHPEVTFRSTEIESETWGEGIFDAQVTGELRIRGISRLVTIHTQVFVGPRLLRAVGSVQIRQSDYRIKPLTFVGGTVALRDEVTLTFDLVAIRQDNH